MDQTGRLLGQKYEQGVDEAGMASETYGAVVSFDVFRLIELRKDLFSEDFTEFDAHLVCVA